MAGLYIHIPFCRSKCAYCDFYSTPDAGMQERYVRLLLRELDMRLCEIAEPFGTVYLGGGTPSLLTDQVLAALFEGLNDRIRFAGVGEVTIEANPEDVSDERLAFYRSLGINRVSIGVQSFSDAELMAVARRHSSAAALAALEALSRSGMNYNADLIYGLPGQNLMDWKMNVERMLSFRPPHMSAYLLSYEPGTRLYAKMIGGKIREATEAQAEGMYLMLCGMMASAGYVHYEVSNFALPGMQSRHNSAYWTYTPYLGLGPSAHSFDGHVRRFNPVGLKNYESAVSSGTPFYIIDNEDDVNRFNDYVITSLRTSRGFDVVFARNTFGSALVRLFETNAANLPKGCMELSDDRYRIPEDVWLKSDAVFRELIVI